MSEFVTLPFGDYWCVVFAPEGRVRGICSISTSKSVADEVVRGIDIASPAVRVTKVASDSPPSLLPCVTFELAGSPFDWFGSDSKAERRRIPDADNYFPTLDARAVPGAPMSLSELQALLVQENGSPVQTVNQLPATIAVIIDRIDQTSYTIPTFQDSDGKTVLPAWDDFVKFQIWSDSGGKSFVDAKGISNMLVMALDHDTLMAQLKPRGPLNIHFCPPPGHLTGPSERIFRLE